MRHTQQVKTDGVDPRTNRLLARLEPEDFDALMQEAKVVFLNFCKRLYRQGAPVNAVYFPLSSMVSIIVGADRGPRIEIATIGKEGVVGAMEFAGEGAIGLKLVQLPGSAVRIDASAFQELEASRPRLRNLIDHYVHALMRQIVSCAACNQLHNMEERCARWLLLTHDSASQDTFPLTQDFLSAMLGVRRATVSVTTGMLKKAGLIRYVHGKMTIIDRAGLESRVCDCYKSGIMAYNLILSDVSVPDPVLDLLLPAPVQRAPGVISSARH